MSTFVARAGIPRAPAAGRDKPVPYTGRPHMIERMCGKIIGIGSIGGYVLVADGGVSL